MNASTLVVWDLPEDPPAGDVVLWSEFGDGTVESIPRRIERSDERFRARLLAALHDVAASSVAGTTLVDALEVRPGLSYWWMSLPAAKRWGGVGGVAPAVKLLAFSELLGNRTTLTMTVHTTDRRTASSITALARRLGVTCSVIGVRRSRLPRPGWLRALVLLLRSLTLRHRAAPEQDGDGLATFDYLFRICDRDGMLSTEYFEPLAALARERGIPLTSIHRFVRHAATPSRRSARALLERRSEPHHLLDSVTPSEALHAALLYLRIRRATSRFRPESVLHGDAEIVWPAFADEWAESRRSSHAMSCALAIVRLERLLDRMPRKSFGLYVMENQPWEFALHHAWRAAGHGTLVGVPHSSIRRWDLRYAVDRRDVESGRCPWIRPDLVASNGPLQDAALQAEPILAPLSRPVEALMYLGLAGRHAEGGDRLLVLGELDRRTTTRLLEAVADVAIERPLFKPHPQNVGDARVVDAFDIVDEPLVELLGRVGLVVMGASGTAMLEAVTLGVPVIVLLDGSEPDLRPIRDHPAIMVTRTKAELGEALRRPRTVAASGDFFRLDGRLTGWRILLGIPLDDRR